MIDSIKINKVYTWHKNVLDLGIADLHHKEKQELLNNLTDCLIPNTDFVEFG